MKFLDLSTKGKLLSYLMDNIPDVIYFKDKKGKLILVNQAHAKGLKLKPEDLTGKTDFDIFPKERAKLMAKDDAHVMKTGKPIIDKIERATRPDGVDNYVSTTKIPRFDNKGRVIGLIGITRDITHRIQLEQLLKERQGIEQKLKDTEELNKAKSDFLSIVSHELKTPLAIIKEAVMLIFDGITGAVNEKQKNLLSKAKNNVDLLKRIINDLLDISRIERGKIRLHYSLVNLHDLLCDTLEPFKNLARAKDTTLKYALPKERINIFVDTERINQIISNLINNAIKFTEKGGEIKVEVKILADKVRVGVIDTGIGITKEDLPKIFDKFVQGSKLRGRERKGLGLGLSIAKDFVERHGGEIWAESMSGVGSRFYFTLPRFFTTKALNKRARDKVNALLDKDITTYLINLSIINFKAFKKGFGIKFVKLFKNLKQIINESFREFYPVGHQQLQIVIKDQQIGSYNIIFPEALEKKANRLCELMKDKINAYFRRKRIENFFIDTVGISPSESQQCHIEKLLVNLCVKKIYIGSELRRYQRLPYKNNIVVLLPKNKKVIVQSEDISECGICCVSKMPLKAFAQLTVKLNLPRKKRPLYIKSRVAWEKTLEEFPLGPNKYKLGLEFLRVEDKDKKGLSGFIKSLPA